MDIDATTSKPFFRESSFSMTWNHVFASAAVSGTSSHSRPGVRMWMPALAAPSLAMLTSSCVTLSARERSMAPLSFRAQ